MNLLARLKSSTSKRIFYPRAVNALQELNLYGTRTSKFSQKIVQSTKLLAQKSSASSSFCRTINIQAGELAIGPMPGEIPFQAKVANFVNLIGYVKSPIIRFQTASNGKHFTAIVISPEYNCVRESLLIPVLFEGDLANVVANHVKENDYVFVSGQLSTDSWGILLSESVGKLHIVGENLNFVQGLDKSVSDNKIRGSGSAEELEKPSLKKVEKGIKRVDHNEDSGFGSPMESSDVPHLHTDTEKAALECKPEKVKKDEENLWRDLLCNPQQWWDYRNHKSEGLINEKFPDFKHKENGGSLWVNSAPKWVLHGIAKLEFDVKFIKPKGMNGSKGLPQNPKSNESSWKNLVENPEKWWDNRVGKRSPKAPDFKHKETGEVLWLSRSPDWALSRLPPLKEGPRH